MKTATSKTTPSRRSPRKIAGALVASLLLVASASAQVTPTGPFTGQLHEGFEATMTITPGFAPNPILQGNATYRTTFGAQANTWSYGCNMSSHAGARFMADAGGTLTIEFNSAPLRFGGFFGANQPGPATVALVRFLDAANNLVTTDSITIHNSCDWQWFGWNLSPTTIRKIELTYTAYSETVSMDDLQVDFPFSTSCDSMFCFGDGSAMSCPCGNNSAFSGCANGTGNGAVLYPMGSCSVSMNDAGLAADGLTPNGWAFFFEGGSVLPGGGLPFADGLLCVGGPYRGLEFKMAGASGGAETTVDLVSPPNSGIMHFPGESTYYQCYYHTPGAYSACGSMWNLTNAVSRTWTP